MWDRRIEKVGSEGWTDGARISGVAMRRDWMEFEIIITKGRGENTYT